jgi:N-methylhydantoinase A
VGSTLDDVVNQYEARLRGLEARLHALSAEGGGGGSGAVAAPADAHATGGGASRYRLGVDVGGTFTDLLMIEAGTGRTFSAKVPSTPKDSSIGVLNGVAKLCDAHGIDPREIGQVMHGTTVATNTVLTSSGARVALVTTAGYKQVLQIARSFVPGGLGGWVIYRKPDPLAPLELTIEADERIDALGHVVTPLDEAKLRASLAALQGKGVEALTVSLIHAYANGVHEGRVREIAAEALPGIPVSLSCEVVPEIYEYERAETTVVNSYIRPVVGNYVRNLQRELNAKMPGVNLHILRSDGGLASAEAAAASPVNLLMSGPAGGVAGALWIARQSGFANLLTFDMGGTSTDVALIQDGKPQLRRETRVGDVAVRASSIDVRTVGAGGGSIAYVPDLTKALRVGPMSAGADPGPAAYARGGEKPTVTDANVVLGYLPADAKLGGDMRIDRAAAERAVQTVADAMGLPLMTAAQGIIDIVNENMFGALRLVSVEQGHDPREYALVAFGGAGPLHANALGRLMQSWPVIVPPAPGVLCAHGDATTRIRDEASQTFIRTFAQTSDAEVLAIIERLATTAARSLTDEGIAAADHEVSVQVDLRYQGQGMRLTLDMPLAEFRAGGLAEAARRFDEMHTQLFTFALDAPHEVVNLRAVVQGPQAAAALEPVPKGGPDPAAAQIGTTPIHVDGAMHQARVYDRQRLAAGNRIGGPAIVMQMDTTTLILPGHTGEVDAIGTILIRPAA